MAIMSCAHDFMSKASFMRATSGRIDAKRRCKEMVS